MKSSTEKKTDDLPGDFPLLHESKFSRAEVSEGIIHIGVGAFHRAHQAVYIDALLDQIGQKKWGIVGINLRPESRALAAAITKNDGCYVLKTIGGLAEVYYRKVRSLMRLLDWHEDYQASLAAFSSPDIKLVTITVTESGYYLNEDMRLDEGDALIINDLSLERPQTIYGCLYRGLTARMENGAGPITIQTCDNIQKNGDVLARCFIRFVEISGNHQLLAFLSGHVTFPNSMVDRITPQPHAETSLEIERLFKIHDDPSVLAENYMQWVIENRFATDYPDLCSVGAQVVDDVHPYEEAKIRMLNGGHTAISYLGVLKGYKTFDQAIRDPELEQFFDDFQLTEVLPGLPKPSPVNHHIYLNIIKERFQNQFIKDHLGRICMNGASKFLTFIMPTLRASWHRGHLPIYTLKAIASWFVFMCKVKEDQIGFDYVETKWDELHPMLHIDKAQIFATNKSLWGDVPEKFPEFTTRLIAEIQNYQQLFMTTKRDKG